MSRAAHLRIEAMTETEGSRARRDEPVSAGILLAAVVAREGAWFRVRAGGRERLASCDPSVDPALVEEAIATGARVVLEEAAGALAIVGALATSRSVRIDREGSVRVAVGRFEVAADESATLRTGSAFLRVNGDEVETFGRRVLTRAREVARVLARAIQLN